MRFRTFAFAVIGLSLSAPAVATDYAVCTMHSKISNRAYSSAIVEVESGSEAARAFQDGDFPKGFEAHVRSAYPDDQVWDLRCDVEEYLHRAETMSKPWNEHYPITVIQTGWSGGRAVATVARPSGPRPIEGVVVAVPGAKLSNDKVVNSAEASSNTERDLETAAANRAARAAAQARFDAQVAENKRLADAQRAANDRAIAQYEADVRAWRAESERLRADWQRRVAACNAGDISQCAKARPN